MGDPLDTVRKELQAKRELFVRPLAASGRNWFTGRIVTHVKTEADVKSAATIKLTRARALAEARLAAGRKSLVDDLGRTRQNELRARIIYGALGNFPAVFLDGAGHDQLLDFIVERRFRSIQRMLSYVNPNDARAIIGYPHDLMTSQVNKQSRPLWEGVSINGADKIFPFVLSPLGRTKPKEAIESLFLKNRKKSDRTLIDCPAVITLVHMDALLVANDPDKMTKAITADYPLSFAVDHPYGSMYLFTTGYLGAFGGWQNAPAAKGENVDMKMFSALLGIPNYPQILIDGDGKESIKLTALTYDKIRNTMTGVDLKTGDFYIEANPLIQSTLKIERLTRPFAVGAHLSHSMVDWFHSVTDDRPGKALFDRSFIAKDDLQAGDHVYLANHPLHSSRIASTPWNGEHSLVLDPWQANPFQIRIIGHGILDQPVLQLTQSMLDEVNAFLDVTRAILDKWLDLSLQRAPDAMTDGAATPAQRVLFAQFLKRGDPIQFAGKARVFNMPALVYRRPGRNSIYPGHWVMDLEGTLDGRPIERSEALLFDYDPSATAARPWKDPWPVTNAIFVRRHPGLVALRGAVRRHYAVHYQDPSAGVELFMPLYYPFDPHKGQPVRVGFDDVKKSVFFGLADGKVFVTRPRVSADATYLAYLKQIGAVAP